MSEESAAAEKAEVACPVYIAQQAKGCHAR